MSSLCSLPWCRKPISNRKTSKKFPHDRPSQLAWLDALDAGNWFSIPPETLTSGLILCENHFDPKGNVKRRYDLPSVNSANVKMEPNASEEESEAEQYFGTSDVSVSDFTPEITTRSKRKGANNVREVRVNIVRINSVNSKGAQKRKVETDNAHRSKKTRRSRNKAAKTQSCSESECDNVNFKDRTETSTGLDSIDSDRLSELTNDAVERSSKSNANHSGKRQSVTLMQKMDVIRMHDTGLNQTQISKKMNMGRSTVWQIVQAREKIEAAYRAGAPLRKRIVRRGAFADINEAVYQWYEKVRTQNLFVNARLLLTMAENIANEMGRTDFSPTPGWLSRFKERYNIRFSSTPAKPKAKSTAKVKKETAVADEGGGDEDDCSEEENDVETNEKVTSQDEDAWLRRDWLKNTWPEIRVKNAKTREPYSQRDTFFVEELGILYRVTPKQAWRFKSGKNNVNSMQNFSITEERLTVLLCSNADGSEKRKLLISGQPQSGLPNNLPSDYVTTSDPSNWITKSAFARWINSWNLTLQSESRKILLISNSSPIHIFTPKFSNITIVNIPTRLLSSIHPVNFGIASNFKTRYRRLLLEKLIGNGGFRPVTCLEAIFMLSTAWNELSPNLIRVAFIKAGYFSCSDIPSLPEDGFDCASLISKAAELDLAVPLSKYPFSEYVEIDNSLCAVECTVLGSQQTPHEDHELHVEDFLENDNDAHDNFDCVPVECNLTAADAHNALENMRLFVMSKSYCPQEVHNALSTLESFLLGHNC